jgi:hypothetical protein
MIRAWHHTDLLLDREVSVRTSRKNRQTFQAVQGKTKWESSLLASPGDAGIIGQAQNIHRRSFSFAMRRFHARLKLRNFCEKRLALHRILMGKRTKQEPWRPVLVRRCMNLPRNTKMSLERISGLVCEEKVTEALSQVQTEGPPM